MLTIFQILSAYLLGVLSFGALMLWLLVKLHPKATPPTMHRRKNRDRLPEVRNVPPPMPVCKPARGEDGGDLQSAILAAARAEGNSRFVWQTEAGLMAKEDAEHGIKYEWINLTGEER